MAKTSKPQKYRDGWRIKWFDENGVRKSATYCSYIEADTELTRFKFEVDQIKQGLARRYHEEKTFNDLAIYWMDKVAPSKRSFKDQASIVNNHLVPYFGKMKLKDITNEHAQNYINAKEKDRSKKTIANHLIVFNSMLNFANDMKWLREKPKIRKPKIARNAHAFSYLRNDDEIRLFLNAAKVKGKQIFALYATAVFTGLRAGELAGLHWSDIDFNTRRICVRNSFNKPTKSENVRYVPIIDTLLPILIEWNLIKHSELVFTSIRGTMLGESARIFQEDFHQVLKLAGFSKVNRDGKERNYIRFHDLRHTFASHWMMKGGDIYRLQNVMGHQSIEMTQRYSHLSPHIYKDDYSRFNSISF